MENKPTFPDNVLFQRVELIYRPAENWETCEMPMTSEQLVAAATEALPGYFDNTDQILRIFKDLHFIYTRNEHNNKYYWLVNPA